MRNKIMCVLPALALALVACQGQFQSSDSPTPGGLAGSDAGGGGEDAGDITDVATDARGSASDAGVDIDGDIDGDIDADGAVDGGVEPFCGNALVETGETCDPCPASCDDQNACTTDTLTGAAETCDLVCTNTAIAVCANGDACCPSGCDSGNDDDCSASCGNGVVDDGETCDPPDTCAATCDDADACTTDTLTGSAANCNVACSYTSVTACVDADGCCPAGCNANTDSDCASVCGNDVVEANEACDGNCPASCDDADACTSDARSGSDATCDVMCTNSAINSCTDNDGCCAPGCDATNDSDCAPICGNQVVEPTEICDGNCPASCNDNDACTTDASSGTAAACSLTCSNTAVTACTGGDGCCPAGCDATTDSDCAVDCRNDATWPANWKAFEADVVVELNKARAAGADCGTEGVFAPTGALTMNPELREASRCHSLDMGTNDFFSHTGSNGSRFSQRASAAGYSGFAVGENIGAGYNTPAAVVAGWVASDGHCRNLMKPSAKDVGVGFVDIPTSTYDKYWTMITGQ